MKVRSIQQLKMGTFLAEQWPVIIRSVSVLHPVMRPEHCLAFRSRYHRRAQTKSGLLRRPIRNLREPLP